MRVLSDEEKTMEESQAQCVDSIRAKHWWTKLATIQKIENVHPHPTLAATKKKKKCFFDTARSLRLSPSVLSNKEHGKNVSVRLARKSL